MRVFAIAVFLFVAASIIPGRAAESVLQGVHTQAADDSSVQIALQFSGDLPDARIVRSGEHTVHVVFVGQASTAFAPPENSGEVHDVPVATVPCTLSVKLPLFVL